MGLSDREIEVMVIYQPVPSDRSPAISLANLYGICADNPISLNEGGIDNALVKADGAFE